MNPLINYKKTYTLAYIYNHDVDKMRLVSFTANEIQEAYNTLPRHRGRVCWNHDLRSRLREIIEISGRLTFNITLSKKRHKSETARYVQCAYHKDCWNCQKTLKDDYATYMALSLGEINDQKRNVRELIGDTNNQEVLFVFDSGPSHISNPLDSLFSSDPISSDQSTNLPI